MHASLPASCSRFTTEMKPNLLDKVKAKMMLLLSWCRVPGKGDGSRENWEKVQVLLICRGVGVFPSRGISDEYRN